MDPDRQARIDKIKKFLSPDNRRVYPQRERLDTPLEDLPSTPLLKTVEELMAEAGHLPPMLVEGLLPDHSLFLLTGKPKAGKSFLALDIADCVSKGTPVLGALNVSRPGPVIYLALEDGNREIARRLTHRGHPQLITNNRVPHRGEPVTSNQQPVTSSLYFITEPFTLTDPHHFARFRAMAHSLPAEPDAANRKSKIENRKSAPLAHSLPAEPDAVNRKSKIENRKSAPLAQSLPDDPAAANRKSKIENPKSTPPSLIVIDTAAEALDIRDWINRAEILAKIAPLRKLARELCTVLLVAHNRKADGDMGDEIAGSNALAGAVDGWISAHKVERRPNGNRRLFLRVEGRGGVGSEMVAEMDHATLHFSRVPSDEATFDAFSARENAHTARRQERCSTALHTFQSLGERVTIADLAAALRITYNSAWSIVRELCSRGDIEETLPDLQSGSRRTPVYRLTPRKTTVV